MDISAIITKTIADLPKDEPRAYIGASSIGHPCDRAIWYGFKGADSEPFNAELKTTFDIGKRLEPMILDYMELAKLVIVRPSEKNNFLLYKDKEAPLFQGHADALILREGQAPAIVEIKTARSSSFANFKSKGLLVWNEAYFAQIHAYMGMAGYSEGVLVAINKDSSEIHHEWVVYDDVYYHELRAKAKTIARMKEPPERLNKNPIFYVCNRCQYRRICHVNRD